MTADARTCTAALALVGEFGADRHDHTEPVGQAQHDGDADDDAEGEDEDLEGTGPGGDVEALDGVLGGTDDREAGQEHDDPGRDDE